MTPLYFYYDYACPFCKKGYELLQEVMPSYPEFELVYVPCEANPRPSAWGNHSDLLAAGYYIAQKQGIDINAYHTLMFKAALVDRVNIEDAQVLKGVVAGLVDEDTFVRELEEGTYADQVKQNNHETWGVHHFQAVPSMRIGDRYLHAVPGYGIDRELLEGFLGKLI